MHTFSGRSSSDEIKWVLYKKYCISVKREREKEKTKITKMNNTNYADFNTLIYFFPRRQSISKEVHDKDTCSMYYIYLKKTTINITEIGLVSLLLLTYTTWHGVKMTLCFRRWLWTVKCLMINNLLYELKVNNKDTRKTLLTKFWCLLMITYTTILKNDNCNDSDQNVLSVLEKVFIFSSFSVKHTIKQFLPKFYPAAHNPIIFVKENIKFKQPKSSGIVSTTSLKCQTMFEEKSDWWKLWNSRKISLCWHKFKVVFPLAKRNPLPNLSLLCFLSLFFF